MGEWGYARDIGERAGLGQVRVFTRQTEGDAGLTGGRLTDRRGRWARGGAEDASPVSGDGAGTPDQVRGRLCLSLGAR